MSAVPDALLNPPNPAESKWSSLGELLVGMGKLSARDLDRANAAREEAGGQMGTVLVNLGLVSETDVAQAQAQLMDLPFLLTNLICYKKTIMPAKRTTPKGYKNACELRKNLTPAEQMLWTVLRGNNINGVSFRRQHAIGKYVADFCSIKAKLIIEVDGGQHAGQEEYDRQRTKDLEEMGFKVIRFWNNQVMNELPGVILAIQHALEEKKG